MGNITVRELSKSLFKLIYSFKNDLKMSLRKIVIVFGLWKTGISLFPKCNCSSWGWVAPVIATTECGNIQNKTRWDRRNRRNFVNLFCSPIQDKVGIGFCHRSRTRFILLNSCSSQLWDAALMPHVLWRVPFGIRSNFYNLKSSWEGLLFILKASCQRTVWDGGKITSDLE